MEAYSATDIGMIRQINQDSVYCCKEQVGVLSNLFVVADGMGGHKAGDLASKLTVDTIVDVVKNTTGENQPIKVIGRAIQKANEVVMDTARISDEYSGMGTTVVVACIMNNVLYVANVGDSRLYVADKDGIVQVTKDHSYVEALVSIGQLDRSEARNHEKKNVITRAIGFVSNVEADYFEVELKSDDVVLMCTDGLTNMVDDSEILRVIKKDESVKQRVDQLIMCANSFGGRDNIGIILIDI